MEHPIFQEDVIDGNGHLERTVVSVRPTGTSDKYAFTGSYHGSIISHLDAINCHMLEDGKGYNGRSWEDVKEANGCPKGDITALKDGVVTRAILFDGTLLPGKAPKGWLEPGTAVHREDLEALEKLEHVKVSEGDVILLYTGRWKRRAAVGPWKTSEGVAGWHADVAFFLKERGVSLHRVTLHVGAGTFLPVKVADTAEHRMHAEQGSVSGETAAALNSVRRSRGRIVAVGSTSLRLLESASIEDGTIRAFSGETALFITPGYRFRVVDVLMTNFHLPRSTLFMLVSAFCGLDVMKRAYAHAIESDYRFYSYGDACLLFRE